EEGHTASRRYALDDGIEVTLERLQRVRFDAAVGEAHAPRIVLHEGVSTREPFEPAPVVRLLPLELDVSGGHGRHPRHDRSPPAPCVRDAHAIGRADVLYARRHGTILIVIHGCSPDLQA